MLSLWLTRSILVDDRVHLVQGLVQCVMTESRARARADQFHPLLKPAMVAGRAPINDSEKHGGY